MAFDDIDAMATRDTLIDLLTRDIDQGLRLAVQRAAAMEAQYGPAAATCWGALSGQLIEAAVLADLLSNPRAGRGAGLEPVFRS
ncbi:hypothetical protein F8271_27790 [Micromonospora sp. ALFpr18c]|uniref:hypothetical protein n=1 Tax=unclassified Micromonospora TaxID=2617518 RepID=UPI00124B7E7A|nr:hypothetical protein [Micromonospora sp. ALFpr18c]KAB1930651.1 hypothetical protein F8271_27790 [Micromonospora sp. ALFpr18c]